jgi:predicted RNA-binding protein with PIN domain
MGRTLGIVAGFLGFGLLLASAGGLPAAPAPAYPPPLMRPPPSLEAEASGQRWLIDGFNVLHVALLHGRERGRWWEEEARERLMARLARFDEPGAQLQVVFDGPRPAEASAEEGASVVFAEDADAWLLREVGREEDPAQLIIVTADRSLADRARHRGAQVVSPKAFLARCG